ncbi:MAG: HPP family protein [Planctomycetes bacterium]|nr:HPP family protein [Planctomycetota bacterium]
MLKTRLTLAGLLGACLALMFVGSIALLGAAPMIAPPIGATAFLCASAPTAPASSPRNVLFGHAIGLVCGFVAAYLFGAWEMGAALAGSMCTSHVFASALALALTTGLMLKLRCHHPPAGATTLVVALGVIRTPMSMLHLELGAALVVVFAALWHRMRGVHYPAWKPLFQPKV